MNWTGAVQKDTDRGSISTGWLSGHMLGDRLTKNEQITEADLMKDIAPMSRTEQLRDLIKPTRLTRIVDVGASPINPAPYDALLAEGMAEVFGFEPQKSAYDRLQKNPVKNRKVLPYAIGDGATGTLHVCASSGFTSLLEPNPSFLSYMGKWSDKMQVIETVNVQTRRLDTITEIPGIDLLKIDIQGGELSVFKHGEQKIRGALAVFTEVAAVQLYKDQPLLDDQMSLLRSFGFDLHKFAFFKNLAIGNAHSARLRPRRHANQLIDGDAIFIRDLLALKTMETEDLKHLAILADAVFASFDLVVGILTHLAERDEIDASGLDAYIARLPHLLPA